MRACAHAHTQRQTHTHARIPTRHQPDAISTPCTTRRRSFSGLNPSTCATCGSTSAKSAQASQAARSLGCRPPPASLPRPQPPRSSRRGQDSPPVSVRYDKAPHVINSRKAVPMNICRPRQQAYVNETRRRCPLCVVSAVRPLPRAHLGRVPSHSRYLFTAAPFSLSPLPTPAPSPPTR